MLGRRSWGAVVTPDRGSRSPPSLPASGEIEMLQWVSKLLNGVTVDVPPGVSTAWVARLEALLKHLDTDNTKKARPGLARDVLAYVLQGEPVSVLAQFSANRSLAELLQRRNLGDRKWADELYEGFDGLPGEVILRWGQFLDAIATGNSWTRAMVFPGGINWPEALLLHATGRLDYYWTSDHHVPKGLSVTAIEKGLEAAGLPASTFVTGCFASPVGGGHYGRGILEACPKIAGFGDAIHRHAETVRPMLLAASATQRLHVLDLLSPAAPATLTLFIDELTELATSSSKQVRAAADPLLRKVADAAVAPLKKIAVDAKPEQRVNALRWLWEAARLRNDDALRAELRTSVEADKAPSVQALASEWDGGSSTSPAQANYEVDVPVIQWHDRLTPEVDTALEALWKSVQKAIEQTNKEGRDQEARSRASTSSYKFTWKDLPPVSAGEQRRLRDYIASPEPRLPGKPLILRLNWRHAIAPILDEFAQAEGVGPVALAKACLHFCEPDIELARTPLHTAVNAMHRSKGVPTLLELQEILRPMGVPSSSILRAYCAAWGKPLGQDWSPDATWPYFAANLELLLAALKPPTQRDYAFDRGAVFRAIGTMPVPPSEVINTLFDLALGTAKSERPNAQAALHNLPGKEARIINALSDGKSEVRAVAANWIAALRYEPAIAAIEQALKDEKNDVAKGAFLDALEAFGRPVEQYIDRDKLTDDARKTLAKETPKDLEWLPWGGLPRVLWSDSGKEVAPELVKGLLIQAYKQKSPEPNAILRKVCGMMDPRDREALGQFVLEGWLREDVRPISAEEALQRARAQAQQLHGWMTSHPQYYPNDPNLGKSVEELTAAFLPAMQRTPAGSAAPSKGLLAIAAACCGERAAAPVARFLKEYYGTRAAQGKALIAMLAWIEHPTATQLMLSIGSRFRTKSFQEEATRQAEALAERKGWTLSELADRTIPSAGFDEAAELALSYGNRRFTARLLADFKIEVFNPEGKKIAALPEPRQDDDAELAKESKKALSTAKKEIKSIVDLQTDRLYEAMCTGRDWSFSDWQLYLNQHPIMRRLIQRLVWAQVEDGRVVQTFRPLDDGTLTDASDESVTLVDSARVRVAHESSVASHQAPAWQQHMIDYEVQPLFQQFGKGQYALPEGKHDLDEITDFKGYLLEAFALRGRALKLGYTRGQAEDGGVFVTYEKRFATLGINTVIEFTGNGLPEENRTVALLGLSFCKIGESGWHRSKMQLSDVPAVLLSECYHDVRTIAAEGTGFDADWEKKSAF
jgi:hypothetical protein